MSARDDAKELLVHYFCRVVREGDFLDSDSRSEIESIVDRIIDAAVEDVRSMLPARGPK